VAGLLIVVVAFLVLRPESPSPPDSTTATNAVAATDPAPVEAPTVPAPPVPDARPDSTVPEDGLVEAPSLDMIDTNSVSELLNYGNWLLDQDRIDEAEEAYRRAVGVNPDDDDAHFNLGIALARQRRFAEAVEQYELTLRIYPDYLEAKNNLANSLIMLGRTNDAIAQLEEALLVDPDYVQALNNLGRLRAVQKEYDEASKHLERARDLDPEDFQVRFNLGTLQSQQGNYAAAAAAFEAAHQLQPDHLLTINLLAQALTLNGEADRAFRLLNQTLAQNPDSPELLFNTALLHMQAGRPAEAVTLLQKAVKIAPTFTQAQTALAEAEKKAAEAIDPPALKSAE
jgi:superkiller protein 3